MKRALLLLLLLLPATVHAQTSVIVRGKPSSANATTTPLAGNAAFTGGWELARDYTTLTVSVFSDKASAAGGLEVQWSSDAVNVDLEDTYSITANVGASWTTVAKGIYYRIVYTNGAATQTAFRLSAILRQSGAPGYTDDGLTNTELRATPVPVSGTVTANVGTGTQPVSGTVTANAGTGPWPITDNGGSITVDGTFWQATQPVSGTVTANAGTGTMAVSGPVTDTQLRATPVPVSGTVTANAGTGTLAVSGPVTDTQLRATPVPISGTVTANVGTGTQPVSGTFWQATQPVSGTFWQATQPVSGTVTITPPTLTKGTQGSTGVSTQDLHDAGRTAISFYANNVAAGTTTTETLITLTQSKGTGATSSASTYTITSGKTLRITGIQVASRGNATATVQSTVFNLRLNTAGACVVTSTPILMGIQSATAAVASAWDRVIIPIPDGYEIAGNGTISLCISAAATYTTNAPTWSVNLIGYEY